MATKTKVLDTWLQATDFMKHLMDNKVYITHVTTREDDSYAITYPAFGRALDVVKAWRFNFYNFMR